jgi:hypothetical protein
MQLVLTPHYKDLFPGEDDSLETLLTGIPTIVILQLIAMMDAELFLSDEEMPTQLKLLNLVLARQAPERRLLILHNALGGRSNKEVHCQFFTRHYNLTFMHHVLIHGENGDIVELTPQQELNIFKAYFLAAQLFGQAPLRDQEESPAFDADYFAKMMWPGLADGYEINFSRHPYYSMIRGIVFLNYLKNHTAYQDYVTDFLSKHGKATTLNYVFDIFRILEVGFRSLQNPQREFVSFTVGQSAGFETLFEQFSLNITAYREKYSVKKENYAGIKACPLLKLNGETWLVLNWSFLSNKLYDGLIFDFYSTSGISAEKELSSFLKFKKLIGEQITEKYLFKLLAKACWTKKSDTLLFDEGTTQGFPDVYYRTGNKLFIFEIKDAFFSSAAINSFSYEAIKSEVDLKLNSAEKGTGQLIKQLRSLKEKPFEYPQRYKKAANLEIYPIIIFTDIHFNMPGVSEYVGRSFDQMLTAADLRPSFRKIWPLTMININYLVGHFNLLQHRNTSLDKFIEFFHQKIINHIKKHKRLQKIEHHQNIYDFFENITKILVPAQEEEQRYIQWTYDALNLKEGLADEQDNSNT